MKYLIPLLVLAYHTSSFGWGDLGHSAIGHIAEKTLSPKGKGLIHSVLGADPMGLAAIWPDQVRDDSRYTNFASYHFFDFPYGTTYETIPADRVAPRSADTMLIYGPALVSKSRLSVLQKQVILRYLIHIVGDLHQPLHVGNSVDMGANLCDVNFTNVEGRTNKMNLHSVWDTGIVDYIKKDITSSNTTIRYFNFRHFADALYAEAERNGTLTELKKIAAKTTKKDWYKESQDLHAVVYPDASPVKDPTDRTYCKVVNPVTGKVEDGRYNVNSIPSLSSEYVVKAKAVAKRQILLAGLRLAQAIELMAKDSGSSDWSSSKEADFFRQIMPEKGPKSDDKEFHHDCTEAH